MGASLLGAFLVAFAAMGFGSCIAPGTGDAKRWEYTRILMGAECRLVFFSADAPAADADAAASDAAKAAFAAIAALEDVISDWRVNSELTKLNAAAGKGPQRASPTLCDATLRAISFAQQTDGAFDPTVLPLVKLWRAAHDSGAGIDPAAQAAAHALVGWRNVTVDAAAGTIALARPGVALDFGGIGMGIGADLALAALRERGFARAMVDFSGDIACGDAPPGADGWKIAVGSKGEAAAVEVVTLVNASLAASGPTEQSIDVDGVRWSHVVDPRTGRFLQQPTIYTVIARDTATADALSTAASVLGPSGGRALVAGVAGARLIVEDPRYAAIFGVAAGPKQTTDLLASGDLSAWIPLGDAEGYRVVDGVLEIPAHGGGTLRTREILRDFSLSLEFQLAMGANSGVFLRADPDQGNPAFTGCELQLIDDFNWGSLTGTPLKTWQHTGSLYGSVAAPEEALAPIGDWNRLDVLYVGSRLAVALNGSVLYDVDTFALKPEQGPPFAERVREGFIGLQRYGAPHVKDGVAARFRRVLVSRR